jgi:hypothetical protein
MTICRLACSSPMQRDSGEAISCQVYDCSTKYMCMFVLIVSYPDFPKWTRLQIRQPAGATGYTPPSFSPHLETSSKRDGYTNKSFPHQSTRQRTASIATSETRSPTAASIAACARRSRKSSYSRMSGSSSQCLASEVQL